MDMLNVAAIYKAIGPAGCALVLAACAAVYFALKNYIYLYIVWRDFRRAYPDIEKGGFGEECMECTGDNPLACIVRDVVHTHAGHSEDIRAEVAYLFHRNFEQVTREICYLRLISVMSPMLGLLGTIFGMCVAIPSLMVYYFLILRFKGFHIEAVEHSYRALDRVRKLKAGGGCHEEHV